MVETLLDENDDWQETFASLVYPKVHEYLARLGDHIGIPLYAVGGVSESQYIGKTDIDEDTLEEEDTLRAR